MTLPNDEFRIGGFFSVTFTREELAEYGGDYARAVREFYEGSGLDFEDVTDDMDFTNVKDRDYYESLQQHP